MDCNTILDMLVVPLVIFFATTYVSEKIKWEQRYSQLISDYRTYDFAAAIQGIVQFFANDCKRDVENIKKEYETKFESEIENTKDSDISPNENILHFQRRLLNSFFYDLNACAKSFYIGKRRVQKDFTKHEADILKILFFMNQAVLDSNIVFKDISTIDTIPHHQSLCGMNKSIANIYKILNESKPYVRQGD